MRLFSFISVALSATLATSSPLANSEVPTEPYIVVQKRQTTGSTVTVSDDIVTNGRVCVQTRCLTAADILYLLDLKAKLTVDAGTNSVKLATAGMTVGARNPLAEIDSLQGTVNSMAPLRAAVTANDQTVNINRFNLNLNGNQFVVGSDDYIRLLTNPADLGSFAKGLAIKRLWARDGMYVNTGELNLAGQYIMPKDGWMRIITDPNNAASYGQGLAASNLYSRYDIYADGGKLKLGDQWLVNHGDDWVRLTTDPNNGGSYGKGVGIKRLWARDEVIINSGILNLGGQFLANNGDDWFRILTNPGDANTYGKGLAAKNLAARDHIWVQGRDVLGEIDYLRNAYKRTVGNNGAVSCSVYCACNWNNELPGDWNGAVCHGTIAPQHGCQAKLNAGNPITCICGRTNTGWIDKGHCYAS